MSDQKKVIDALGGKKGLLDSGLPALLFLIAFNIAHDLKKAATAAVITPLLLAILRLAKKDTLQHVISGLIGVVFCAFLARKTGSAVDYYLPGLIINVIYGSVYLVANLVELTLPDNSTCLGKTVEEITLPENSALAAIVRDGRVVTPKPHEVFTAGDELLFVATAEAQDLLKQCFIAN